MRLLAWLPFPPVLAWADEEEEEDDDEEEEEDARGGRPGSRPVPPPLEARCGADLADEERACDDDEEEDEDDDRADAVGGRLSTHVRIVSASYGIEYRCMPPPEHEDERDTHVGCRMRNT
jgi:hypothetical protein